MHLWWWLRIARATKLFFIELQVPMLVHVGISIGLRLRMVLLELAFACDVGEIGSDPWGKEALFAITIVFDLGLGLLLLLLYSLR